MRRNVITLLKYAIVAGVCLVLGPFTLKLLFGNNDNHDVAVIHRPHGLPIDPRIMKGEEHDVTERMIKRREVEPLSDKIPDSIHKDMLIDWHDYNKIAQDKARTGPGEQGTAVILTAEEEKQKDDLYKVNGFNAFASDKIALDRALNDIRHPDCRAKKYPAHLPTVSVIVPFHNEHWTTLLRTAESILHRSPPQLLKEIILTDDFSSKEHCGKPLDDHLAKHYDGKVRVVRAKKREGLIRTRLLGAKQAKGQVLIFLDSHVEANVNWLPPLLEPIARNSTTVVCPFVDVIDFETFAYRAQDEGARGAFDWQFFYKRLPLLPDHKDHPADPFDSPVMAGGLFAIDKDWFWKLGGYDPGLEIWGGEQYELSFKLWQCGGRMVDVPCSRVGHIYRKFAPFPNPGIGDFVGKNYRRVADVWMDEYKEYLFLRRPHYRTIDPGDLTDQLAIRTKLKCKPFKWFMEKVAFDLPGTYPMIEPKNFAEGEVRNGGGTGDYCLDTKYKNEHSRFGIDKCIKGNANIGGEQQFALSWHHDLRVLKRTMCLDVSQSTDKAPVILYNCHHMQGNQRWKYNLEDQSLFHPVSRKCLDCDIDNLEIFMSNCDPSRLTQRWTFAEVINRTAIVKEWARA